MGLSLARAATATAAVATATAATDVPGAEYRIYAGSTHAHTAITWSHGEHWASGGGGEKAKMKITPEGVQSPPPTNVLKPDWKNSQGMPEEHFARAKARKFDFYVISDHSQEEGLNPPSPDNLLWQAAQKQARAATDANFVALVSYEHSENNGPNGTGHLNVINSAEYLNALAPGVDLPKFYQWLAHAKSAGDGPVVATFNHPSAKQYNEWAYRDDAVTDVITMLEVINSNKTVHYAGWLAALDHGWKVSPVAGNDNHGFSGIERHTTRTFVLAKTRTKPALLEAMHARRTYASLEGNLECRYTANGAIMGSTLPRPAALAFRIWINDPDTSEPNDRITKLDLVTEGGEVVQTFEPAAPAHQVTWEPTIKSPAKRYYFVRVWNAGGGDLAAPQPEQPVAWLAPVWLEN